MVMMMEMMLPIIRWGGIITLGDSSMTLDGLKSWGMSFENDRWCWICRENFGIDSGNWMLLSLYDDCCCCWWWWCCDALSFGLLYIYHSDDDDINIVILLIQHNTTKISWKKTYNENMNITIHQSIYLSIYLSNYLSVYLSNIICIHLCWFYPYYYQFIYRSYVGIIKSKSFFDEERVDFNPPEEIISNSRIFTVKQTQLLVLNTIPTIRSSKFLISNIIIIITKNNCHPQTSIITYSSSYWLLSPSSSTTSVINIISIILIITNIICITSKVTYYH